MQLPWLQPLQRPRQQVWQQTLQQQVWQVMQMVLTWGQTQWSTT
jgi:hypothetical protein